MAINTKYNELIIKRDIIPEITSVSSLSSVMEVENTLNNFIGDKAIVVIWLMDRIIWTTCTNGHIELDDKASVIDYWQEMRAFNEKGEVHLVRMGDEFSGRCIVDTEASEDWKQGYVDSISPIWGENSGYEGGRVHLEDTDRKLMMDIPVRDGSAKSYGLVTRSYIQTDLTAGLSGYGDYRFLAVEAMEV
ncbi:MAG: hypothetical protein K6C05_08370 [Anaerovibrio sp.]|uniref:type III-D CRISPR-associated protein Csx19 n=1 Tax=Anaerovibrio sp. TaxID=1872532 RepID=UPI0025E98638|nr:CRISPR-associated protein Csx19 [Anaerovibrio sp.]MCR5176851.1 hypothetical protein [Anaerovibrio sp.]